MNIIVKPNGSELCYCRPDTTWERENRDFYVPEGIGSISWAPVVFARVSKAGKCISPKFASRYFDAFSFGMLMYCNPEQSEGCCNIAFTSCADHTSVLPSSLLSADRLEEGNVGYIVHKNGNEVFSACADRNIIEDAICKASKLTSLRIGDYVVAELTDLAVLAVKSEAETLVKGESDSKGLYDFKIIF
ncbi:MAG: hypothetical protein IKY66_08920 [Bacteroidales bacterium]|nr:hypothetical protein [Bacteroidales bacterium]